MSFITNMIAKELIQGAKEIFTQKDAFKANLGKPSSVTGYTLIAFGLTFLSTQPYIGLSLVVCGLVLYIFNRSKADGNG